MQQKRINVITLGCSKNRVDSEHLMAQLAASGFALSWDDDPTGADVVVVNTCGFIGDAKEESIDTILSLVRAREEGQIGELFVMGCLSERYREELRAEIPEVDRFFGVNDLSEVVRMVGATYRESLRDERTLTTPPHYAYLKISEGCDRGCGFCAIPLIRGRHISVPLEELVGEAEKLAAKGVRELIVIAQDTTSYGLDLYGERRLGELLGRLSEVEGIRWIRLHYAYPAQFPRDVIDQLRENPKVCRYLDIPFQHIADSQLRSMRRGVSRARTLELIDTLRREVPGIALRTTLLVGYPGETQADFEELLAFVRSARFERLGAFAYSEEEGTYSALELTDDVPDEEKQRRVERVMELQSEISLALNQARVGRTEEVLIDRSEGEFWVGRTEYDSPEVDTEILIRSSEPLVPGGFYRVRITGAEEYDLYAEPEA